MERALPCFQCFALLRVGDDVAVMMVMADRDGVAKRNGRHPSVGWDSGGWERGKRQIWRWGLIIAIDIMRI